MKVVVCGKRACEEFISICPDITLVDLDSVVSRVFADYPDVIIEMCTNIDVKQSLVHSLEEAYENVAFVRGGVVDEVVIENEKCPVYVSQDIANKYGNSQILTYLTKLLKGCCKVYDKPQEVLSLFQTNTQRAQVDQEMLVLNTLNKEVNKMPSIEESIRKAMAELGVDGETPEAKTPDKKPEKVDKPTKKAEKKPKPQSVETEPIDEEPEQLTLNFDQNEPEPEAKEIYCKIKDGHLALIIPIGMPLEQRDIAGMKVNVLNVSLPDLQSTKLQSLQVFEPVVEKPQPVKSIKRVPIILPHDEPEDDENDDELQSLIDQKHDIDQQIKAARAQGDEELVSELRKTRRALRSKINALS